VEKLCKKIFVVGIREFDPLGPRAEGLPLVAKRVSGLAKKHRLLVAGLVHSAE
jgi:hypothetical protein